MILEEFNPDDKGNRIAVIGDVTVTIAVHGDTVMIEQDGDGPERDLIMMFEEEQVRGVIARLQEYLDQL